MPAAEVTLGGLMVPEPRVFWAERPEDEEQEVRLAFRALALSDLCLTLRRCNRAVGEGESPVRLSQGGRVMEPVKLGYFDGVGQIYKGVGVVWSLVEDTVPSDPQWSDVRLSWRGLLKTVVTMDVWVTKDGRSIPVAELADGHLKNILAKMQREPGWKESYRSMLTAELNRRAARAAAEAGAKQASLREKLFGGVLSNRELKNLSRSVRALDQVRNANPRAPGETSKAYNERVLRAVPPPALQSGAAIQELKRLAREKRDFEVRTQGYYVGGAAEVNYGYLARRIPTEELERDLAAYRSRRRNYSQADLDRDVPRRSDEGVNKWRARQVSYLTGGPVPDVEPDPPRLDMSGAAESVEAPPLVGGRFAGMQLDLDEED